MNGLGNFQQTEVKPINPTEFVKMIEDWNEQLRPIMDFRKQQEQEQLEKRRQAFMKYVNENFGNCERYIVADISAI
jgi:hypothetical protein